MSSCMYRKFLQLSIFVFLFMTVVENSVAGDMERIVSDLQSNHWKTRLAAVEELGRIRGERSTNLLTDVVDAKFEKWEIRIRAIRLLGEIGDPRVAPLLIKVFTNPFCNKGCPAILWNTAIALGNFKNNPEVVDTLIDALEYDNLIVREGAIQSLGEIGDPRAVPFLISSLKDKSFAVKLSAIKSLGKIGDTHAIPLLKHIADTETDPYIKNEALAALKILNNK